MSHYCNKREAYKISKNGEAIYTGIWAHGDGHDKKGMDKTWSYKEYLKKLKDKNKAYILNMSNRDFLNHIDKVLASDSAFFAFINNAALTGLVNDPEFSVEYEYNIDDYTRAVLHIYSTTEHERYKFNSYWKEDMQSSKRITHYDLNGMGEGVYLPLLDGIYRVQLNVYMYADKLVSDSLFINNSIISNLFILNSVKDISGSTIQGIINDDTPIIYSMDRNIFIQEGTFCNLEYKYIPESFDYKVVSYLTMEQRVYKTLYKLPQEEAIFSDFTREDLFSRPAEELLEIFNQYSIVLCSEITLVDNIGFSNCTIGLVKEVSHGEYGRLKKCGNIIKQIVRINKSR